ncbi:MAG: hypothetical protein KJ904_00060 [Alphaproteobacteria bacterium]|uniref:Uncharacterized protein n=1 Tax=viral metagenome TaxID=1070528 RepID=A0A6M3M118_9ZZZZ|nr:hypothetical protein [Alphaproteobacteria bacterium]MBU0798634.1 hypothetical protein [Alphaproteobacteria bacterium]MBU0885536.1 hypothetical protein [Alphaproteobacteria bacterium]MBU1811886.1 hypothetical protein [Alphaproteobacteria bacterium]MBU2089858.1 hypothetical protein [Alphaproteobacteria bacterium]
MSDKITIKLGGEEVELVCSFKAHQAIQKRFGGHQPAFQSVAQLSADTAVAIIAAATDTKGEAKLAELHEKVYAAGLLKMTTPLVKYLVRLGNGGRDAEDDEAA